MQYVCLIYFDPEILFNQSAESNALLADVGPHDKGLRDAGVMQASNALVMPHEAKTVSVRGGSVSATDGPFIETKEMLGGYIVIEADGMEAAVAIASRIPFARMGHVEVRPVVDFSKPRPTL